MISWAILRLPSSQRWRRWSGRSFDRFEHRLGSVGAHFPWARCAGVPALHTRRTALSVRVRNGSNVTSGGGIRRICHKSGVLNYKKGEGRGRYEGLFVCARHVNYFAFHLLVLVSGIYLRQRCFDVLKNLPMAAIRGCLTAHRQPGEGPPFCLFVEPLIDTTADMRDILAVSPRVQREKCVLNGPMIGPKFR